MKRRCSKGLYEILKDMVEYCRINRLDMIICLEEFYVQLCGNADSQTNNRRF